MGYEACQCGPGWGMRRYRTKDEKLDMLRDYQGELEKELSAVKERMKEIKEE